MPNRVIREGWLESEAIDALTPHAERFFLRLCLKADDFGCYHANPQLLKSHLFPLRSDTRITDLARWLAECETAGLVRCYEVAGKRFLEIEKFDQRLRAKRRRFPSSGPTNDGHVPDACQASADRITNTKPNTKPNTKRLNDAKVVGPTEAQKEGAANRSSSNRSEAALMGDLRELLGADEMARAGGHWRADWVRKHPDLIERVIAELRLKLKEGAEIENRAAWMEDLLKRWK